MQTEHLRLSSAMVGQDVRNNPHDTYEELAAIQSTVPAANVSVRKNAHNTNISKPLGWRVFASHWVVLLLLATEKGPSSASSQGKH